MTEELLQLLVALGFRAAREQLHALLTQLTKSHATPVQVLEQWAALERREREVRNLASRTKKACLGTTKPASDYDWQYPDKVEEATYQELLDLGFMMRRQNILFRGPAGVGKTMLAKNVGLQALGRGHSVVFANLSSALADLLRQESLPAVERRLRRYTTADLVILDELGYQPIDVRAVDLLFQIISRRHEQASTIITTNLSFKDWANVFPGAACLVPLVDRFTENMIAFDIHGASYRQRAKTTGSSTPKKRR
jgi:DNA replication protein DnaC